MDISRQDPAFSAMQNVKRSFFALRNGIIADTLRKAGDPHTIIFGLTLPQLREIADSFGSDTALAVALWDNATTRESRLLAPMLMPLSEFSIDMAVEWIAAVRGVEEADILCHRLLRHTSFALSLIDRFASSAHDLERYTALRLMFNLLAANPAKALEVATHECDRKCSLTSPVAHSLLEEARYLIS